jgi:hypothetical protein
MEHDLKIHINRIVVETISSNDPSAVLDLNSITVIVANTDIVEAINQGPGVWALKALAIGSTQVSYIADGFETLTTNVQVLQQPALVATDSAEQ